VDAKLSVLFSTRNRLQPVTAGAPLVYGIQLSVLFSTRNRLQRGTWFPQPPDGYIYQLCSFSPLLNEEQTATDIASSIEEVGESAFSPLLNEEQTATRANISPARVSPAGLSVLFSTRNRLQRRIPARCFLA